MKQTRTTLTECIVLEGLCTFLQKVSQMCLKFEYLPIYTQSVLKLNLVVVARC